MRGFARRHYNFAVSCLGTVVMMAPGCSQPKYLGFASKNSDLEAIRELMQRRVEAGNRGDVTGWVDCFTFDAIIMPANAPAVVGKEAIEAWERGFEGYRPSTDMNIDEVVVRGDWAYTRSNSSGVFVKDGERFPIAGKEIAILRRVDGHWKFHRICGNKNSGSRFEKSQVGERTR